MFTYEAGYAKNPSHRPDIRAVLAHGPNGHLSGGPTSIGVHANLCMLNTLPSPGAHSAIKMALPDIITITLVHTCMLLSCARERERREREMFYLTTHSTHFIYGYMASDIWLRTILIVGKETRCHHIGYSFRLTARVLLYAPSHRQNNTYHGLCYTSRGTLVGTRNSSMGPPPVMCCPGSGSLPRDVTGVAVHQIYRK